MRYLVIASEPKRVSEVSERILSVCSTRRQAEQVAREAIARGFKCPTTVRIETWQTKETK